MSNALRISAGASLALHGMALLAARPEQPLATREIAEALRVSEAHLSKVLQRLARAGLVTSRRGPRGGFALARPPAAISLLEVYETMDGPVETGECLLRERACCGQVCVLGGLVKSVNEQMRDYLARTRLSEVAKAYPADTL
jgi:Rrf2 family protein